MLVTLDSAGVVQAYAMLSLESLLTIILINTLFQSYKSINLHLHAHQVKKKIVDDTRKMRGVEPYKKEEWSCVRCGVFQVLNHSTMEELGSVHPARPGETTAATHKILLCRYVRLRLSLRLSELRVFFSVRVVS